MAHHGGEISNERSREGQALRWLVRRSDRPGLDADQEAAFQAWLTESPANAEAYERAAAALGEMDRSVAYAPGEIDATLRRHERRVPAKGRPRPVWACGAAAAVLLLAIVIFALMPQSPHSYATAVGERTSLTLPDGTRVELGAASRIEWHDDGGLRQVRLLAGSAVFTIAEADQPFELRSGGFVIRDIGTTFSVGRRSRLNDPAGRAAAVEVAVLEGAIEMAVDRPEKTTPLHRLDPGERAHWADAAEAPELSTFAPGDFALWRKNRLSCHERPLAEVLADLQRHYEGRIELRQPWLGDLKVSGTLRSDDLEAALAVLREILPIRIVEFTNQRLVIAHAGR